jgi:biofilm PGA synthesis N-glycosyltransferase PgaC
MHQVVSASLDRSYVLVSPVRNEAPHIELTIRAVLAQEFQPLAWLIIDDGSTDGTSALLDSFARRTPWIRVVRHEMRPTRELGGNIAAMLHQGLEELRDLHWEYWGKLDGDVEVGPQYFGELILRFEQNPRLGIASGKMIVRSKSGMSKPEWSAGHQPWGAARLYRRACWDQISPLAERRLWDVIDVYRARMLGWDTCNFLDLPFHTFRETDAAQQGRIARRLNLGESIYSIGYSPLYAIARCARAMWDESPLVTGGMAMLAGYLIAALRGDSFLDTGLRDFIRNEQNQRIQFAALVDYLRRRREM